MAMAEAKIAMRTLRTGGRKVSACFKRNAKVENKIIFYHHWGDRECYTDIRPLKKQCWWLNVRQLTTPACSPDARRSLALLHTTYLRLKETLEGVSLGFTSETLQTKLGSQEARKRPPPCSVLLFEPRYHLCFQIIFRHPSCAVKCAKLGEAQDRETIVKAASDHSEQREDAILSSVSLWCPPLRGVRRFSGT
jgi:hypothetical protein